MTFAEEREAMVERQLRRRGIAEPRVLSCMGRVPRELFVPERTRFRAYHDGALGIGEGQTISQPYMVARTCELAAPGASDVVLEVGAGSGYQAAVLGCLASRVIAVERIGALAVGARAALRAAGSTNVEVAVGDGSRGWPSGAPYDCIVVAAASPAVPASLIDQLAIGGRLVIPVGSRHSQDLLRIFKRRDGTLHRTVHEGCVFVPLLGEEGWPADR